MSGVFGGGGQGVDGEGKQPRTTTGTSSAGPSGIVGLGGASWQDAQANAQWIAEHPGFKSGDRFSTGELATGQHYQEWYQWLLQDPGAQAAFKKFGNDFIRFEWEANLQNLQGQAYEMKFVAKFGVMPTAFFRSPGGGGGGGGQSKAQSIAAAMAAIKNQAAELGLPIDDGTLRSLATTVVNENWSADMLTDHLLKDPSKITLPGNYAATADQLKGMANRQLVTIADGTAKEWAQRILSGEMSIDTVNNILQQQAAGEFGWAADLLASGATMSDILSPARDLLARELEINPNDVNLMDTRWRNMVQVTNTDNSKRAATLTEVVQAARKDPGWAKTANSARMAASVANMLRNVMEGT